MGADWLHLDLARKSAGLRRRLPSSLLASLACLAGFPPNAGTVCREEQTWILAGPLFDLAAYRPVSRGAIMLPEGQVRLVIFGASGRLGAELLKAARDRGHTVIAHARNRKSDSARGIEWITGDVAIAVSHADAVLMAFGPRSTSDVPFCASETRNILAGMRRHGVGRVLCVTGAMIGDYPGNRTWCFQRLAAWIQRRYRALMEDRAQQESLIRSSGMNWTVFKPPRLTEKRPRGNVTAGPAVRAGLLSSISRADLARVMIDELEQGRFAGQFVFAKGRC